MGFSEWETKSIESFWSARGYDGQAPKWLANRVPDRSFYAVPSATDLLAKSFGLKPTSSSPARQVDELRIGIQGRLRDVGSSLRVSMKALGVDVNNSASVDRYLRTIKLDKTVPADQAESFYNMLGRAARSDDYGAQSQDLIADTTRGFDSFFKDVAINVANPVGIGAEPALRNSSFYRDGTSAHAAILSRRMRFPQEVASRGTVHGSGTATLIRKAYHTRYVMGGSNRANYQTRVALTRTEATTAATEVARALRMPEPTTIDESLTILNRYYAGGSAADKSRLGEISVISARPSTPSTPRTTSSARRTTSTTTSNERPARRRSRAQRISDMLRQKGPDGNPRYATREAAEAEYDRMIKRSRNDGWRADFTDPKDRKGKPCGKSFTKKQNKCSKPASKGYAERQQQVATARKGGFVPREQRRKHEVSDETTKKVAQIVAGVGAVTLGGRLAYRNRKKIGKGINRTVKAAQEGADNVSKVTYQEYSKLSSAKDKGRYLRVRAARLARDASRASSLLPLGVIKGLSSKEVAEGISKLPEDLRPQAVKLVGDAKKGAAYMQMRAQGYEAKLIDNENNYSVWKNSSGNTRIVSSVDDILINFNVSRVRQGNIMRDANLPTYNMDFMIDQSFDQRTNVSREQGVKTIKTIRSMFDKSIKDMPDEAIVLNAPYKTDGKGDARQAIYKRAGFHDIEDSDMQWAYVRNKKIEKMDQDTADAMFDEIINAELDEDDFEFDSLDSKHIRHKLLRVRTDSSVRKLRIDATPERKGKPCGKSFIGKTDKCTKKSHVGYAQKAAAIIAGAAAVATGVALTRRPGRASATTSTPRTATSAKAVRSAASTKAAATTPSDPEWDPNKMTAVEPPPNRSGDDWVQNVPNIPGLGENLRGRTIKGLRKMPVVKNAEVVKILNTVATTREGKRFAAMAKKGNFEIDSPTMYDIVAKSAPFEGKEELMFMIDSGQMAGFASGYEGSLAESFRPVRNKIYLNAVRDTAEWNVSAAKTQAALKQHLKQLSRAVDYEKKPTLPARYSDVAAHTHAQTTFNTASKDTRDLILMTHEMGHVMDIMKPTGKFSDRTATSFNGKQVKVTDPEFVEQAQRTISNYGKSDLGTTRQEFFAEANVLYVHSPETLKQQAPLVYNWVEDVYNDAEQG